MSHWATKRKLSYIGAFFTLLFIGIALPTFFTVYEPPTCEDGKQNQKEQGVDCGGPCSILCKAGVLKPIILWQRVFKITEGNYNAIAYIENPNLDSGAKNVSYVFKFYDEKGFLIYEREGKKDIPPNRIFPIFEDRIETENQIPTKVTFDFTEDPTWIVDKSEPVDIRVKNQALLEDKAFPRVVGTVENRSVTSLYNLEVVAIIYDSNENAVATSRTFVDVLPKNGSEDVVFTWPTSLDFGSMACEKPADVMLVLDRSGSMDDDAISPPQPLTAVKSAAQSFVDTLKERDMVGVVSFATEASNPIDESLTFDISKAKKVISDISIRTDSPQNTNIADGIFKAKEELLSNRHRGEAKPVIVLLTDGVPSHPIDENDPEFPKKKALEEAQDVKTQKVELYVIGLGKKVDALFLRSLASSPEFYFEALSGNEVEKIYKNIAANICEKGPTKIQIIPLVK